MTTWYIGAWEIDDEFAYNTKTGEKITIDEWDERLHKILMKM